MKNKFLIAASIIIIALSACTSTYNVVSSDYDRSVDFTKYKTFAWLPDKADTAFSPYNNEIIRNNIRNYFGFLHGAHAPKRERGWVARDQGGAMPMIADGCGLFSDRRFVVKRFASRIFRAGELGV